MKYRHLGKSGVKLSTVGIGTNRFGAEHVPQAKVDEMIAAALELGINHLDTANVYQDGRSETMLGKALKGKWDKFFLATKFRHTVGPGPNDGGASRFHILNAVEGSLQRLQNDHIDLYYVHSWDDNTPIEETLDTLNDLVHNGKVRYIAASNFAAWQLARANLLAEMHKWEPFVAIQEHYHLLERKAEQEIVPLCQAINVAIIPYFPLAGGFLTGKYQPDQPIPAGSRGASSPYVQKYMTPENFTVLAKLTAWAKDHGHAVNELAIAWLLAQPQVASVISGATRVEHIQANASAGEWELSKAEEQEVRDLLGD